MFGNHEEFLQHVLFDKNSPLNFLSFIVSIFYVAKMWKRLVVDQKKKPRHGKLCVRSKKTYVRVFH